MGEVWGIVEIMGRRTRAGMLSDTQMGGAQLLRIEHPTAVDHTGEEPLTELYAPAAIFAVRLCSREEAETVAAWAWRPTTAQPALPAVLDSVEVGDDDDDDVDWPPEDDDVDWPPEVCANCGAAFVADDDHVCELL